MGYIRWTAGERRDRCGDQRFQPITCDNANFHTNSWESTLTHTHPNTPQKDVSGQKIERTKNEENNQ